MKHDGITLFLKSGEEFDFIDVEFHALWNAFGEIYLLIFNFILDEVN